MADKVLVKHFMRKKVIFCSPKDSIDKAAEKMKNNNIGVLVVTKDKKIVGIISERDIINKVVVNRLEVSKTLVEKIMTKKVITGTPDMYDVDVALLFSRKGIKKLPIIKNDKVVGIITQTDLLKIMSFKWAL